MGVDLDRIGLGISSGWSRTGFGTIVSFPSGPSFPPAGSFNSNLTGVNYLAGASYVIQTVTYYEQYADYIVKNDGAGGTYVDYATASNITYRTGNFLYTTNETHDGSLVTLPYGLGSFPTAQYAGYDYTWNGSPYGGYTQYDYSMNYSFSGQIATDYTNSASTANYYMVDVYGTSLQNGKYTAYFHNSVGSYSSSDNNGSFHPNGLYTGVNEPGMGNAVYWDGNGGYYY
jgi:hypothetical protein